MECCQLAGVQAPSSVLQHAGSIESSISTDTTGEINEIMVGEKTNYSKAPLTYFQLKSIYRVLFKRLGDGIGLNLLSIHFMMSFGRFPIQNDIL